VVAGGYSSINPALNFIGEPSNRGLRVIPAPQFGMQREGTGEFQSSQMHA
jgi:hypothetical protein